jgi:hypothetical protein
MRIDLYTKTILTLVVLLLAVIAFKPIFQPLPVAAQSSLSGVQISGGFGAIVVFDSKSGEVWVYPQSGVPQFQGKLVQVGKPLAK